MNILATTPYFYPEGGGLEKYAYNVFKRMVNKGYSIKVFCATKHGYDYSETMDGIIVNRLRPDIILSNTPIRYNLYNILSNEIKNHKYDLIISHTPVPYFAEIAAIAAYRHNLPYIVTYHVGKLLGKNILYNACAGFIRITFERFALNYATRIITVSELIKNNYLRKFAYKVDTIPSGVDTMLYKPNIYSNNKRLLFIGSLSSAYRWKGLHVLLKALSRVKEVHKDVILTIVGDGPLRPYYEKICNLLNINDNVIFKGRVDENELIRIYQQSTLVVQPSINDVEAFPLVLLEANACGIPFIATKVGGVPYYVNVNKGMNGFLVEPNNDKILADKIIELLSNDDILLRLSKECRRVAERYDWNIIAELTINILENTIKRYRI